MRSSTCGLGLAIAVVGFAVASEAEYQPPRDRVEFGAYEPAQVLGQTPIEGRHDLSLADAIALGLRFNLDVEIERFAPLIAEQTAEAAWGAYDPRFGAEFGYQNIEQPNTFGIDQTPESRQKNLGGEGSLQWLVPWLGASVGVSASGWNKKTNSTIQTLSPQYDSSILFNANIPLLRGLIWNEAWTNVKTSNLGYGISRENFRTRVMDLVQQIQGRYWDLIAAKEQVRVATSSFETAEALLRQSQTQYEVGVVSKVDVVQAEAGVASRDFDLIVASNREENTQDQLIDAVLGPYLTASSSLEFMPTTNPDDFENFSPGEVDRAVALAFERRPELRAAEEQIQRRNIQLRFAKNQWLPQLDFVGSVGYFGRDGRQNPQCVPPFCVAAAPPGSFPDSYDDYFTGDGSLNYSVQAVVSVPLGNTTARKRLSQAELELRRSKTQQRRLEQTIILDIRKAVRTLNAAYRGIGAAERSRVAAAEQLRAEEIRLEYGESTPFEVLLKERDLVSAESQWITAVQTYRNAHTALDREQGTILENNGIHIEDVAPLR